MKSLTKLCSTALILFVLLANFFPVNTICAEGASLTVTPSVFEELIASGTTKTYPITVTNGFALDLEVGGLGQTLAGATRIIPVEGDSSPYTARPWLSIDKNHLEIGTNQILTVTVSVPPGAAAGEHYAAIYLHSAPGTTGNAAIISGIIIPVIFTVDNGAFTRNPGGEIVDLQVANAFRGKALDILTTFTNTGNCRIIGAKNNVTIKDSSQIVKWQSEIPIASPSVLPGYPRKIDARYNVGLNTGNYTVTSEITLAGGTVYTHTLAFTVVEPPALPGAPTLVGPGGAAVPGPVIDSLTPNFEWNAVPGADYYYLTISRDPYTTSDIVFNSEQLTTTSFMLPSGILFSGEKYKWQLTATNVTGTGEASAYYFQTSGSAPSVTTYSAANVTSAGATLNGNLNGRGNSGSVAVSFEYGTTTAYGSTTTPQTLTAAGSFSAVIIGLSDYTVYHFRAKAVGSSTVYGNDLTFTTLQAGILAVSSLGASNITTSGVTLNGNLTNLGGVGSVSVNFEYGTSTSYVNTTSVQSKTAAGTFNSIISGLIPGTTYHFRSKAVGSTTVYGSDMTFTTLAETATPTPTLSPSITPRPTGPPASTVTGSVKNYLLEGMDEASLVVFAFDEQEAFASAAREAGLEVLLSQFKGNGIIALARYKDEPGNEPLFSDPIPKGGTGKPSVKFVDIFVEGVRQGSASVTVYFTADEIRDFDPASLFLAYYFNSKWNRCSNISISQTDMTVTGDISVNRLNGTVVGLGGSLLKEAPTGIVAGVGNNQPTPENSVPWAFAGIVIVTAVVVGGIILVLERNRRKNAIDSQKIH